MPVVFAPAEPFSEAISQGYGATEQFNKNLPNLVNLYEANQRASLAQQQIGSNAAAQTAHNRTAAYQSDAQEQAQAEMQRRQFAQQQTMQSQQQALQWAMQDRAITHADTMEFQKQQNGLAQVMGMLSRNEISPEEAGALTLKLKSGIDLYQQRMEKQHAEDFKAQADLRSQQTANLAKDNAHMEQFESDRIKAGYGTLSFHDQNGRMHVLLKNKKTDEWYNPLLEHNKMDAETKAAQLPGGDYAHLATNGRYDTHKALQDAKAYAEAQLGPRPKDPTGDKPDSQKDAREQWDDLVRRRQEGTRMEFNKSKGGQQQPQPGDQPTGQQAQPNTPSQDAQVQNDQRTLPPEVTAKLTNGLDAEKQKVDGLPVSNLKKQQLKEYLDQVHEIANKPYKTDEDRRNLATLQRLYAEQSR